MADITRIDEWTATGDPDTEFAQWAEDTARKALLAAGVDRPNEPGSDQVFGVVWDILYEVDEKDSIDEAAANAIVRWIRAHPPLWDFFVAFKIEQGLREDSVFDTRIRAEGPCGSAARRLREELTAIIR